MDAPSKTLRIALAMRGGVSMAVWIGGVVAELDLLRRAVSAKGIEEAASADEKERAKRYRTLLDAGGYGRVEFDILAGASAGGLNGILFSLAQTYGVKTDKIVKNLWSVDGGLWELLRDPGFGGVRSILKGDERLLTLAQCTVRAIAAEPETTTPIDDVTVVLAATLLPDPQSPELGNRAGFTFTHRAGGLSSNFTTMPGRDGKGIELDSSLFGKRPELPCTVELVRMALAARATSSFPGAFEPASVHSVTDLDEYGPRRTNDDTVDPDVQVVNMDRVFPYARDSTVTTELGRDYDRFRLVDGGVFDNIPIDRALRAISRAPAGGPTERRLLYLDPQPPTDPDPMLLPEDVEFGSDGGLTPASRPRLRKLRSSEREVKWARVLLTSKALQARVESANDEIDLIRQHNDTVLATAGRTKSLVAAIVAAGASLEVGVGQYIESRIRTDVERLGDLVMDPWTEMCRPPHSSRKFVKWNPQKALVLEESVSTAYNRVASEDELFETGDVGALLDFTRILIAWVQLLQRVQAGSVKRLKFLKRALYRNLTTLAEARRMTVDVALLGNEGEPADRIRNGLLAQRRLVLSTRLMLQLSRTGNDGDSEMRDAEMYRLLSNSDHLYTVETTTTTLERLWDNLNRYLTEIRRISRELREDAAASPDWRMSIYRQLAADQYDESTPYEIARLFSLAGVPDTAAAVRFHQITGDMPPADAVGMFGELRRAAIEQQLEHWIRAKTKPGEISHTAMTKAMRTAESLGRADLKLCGTPIARFAGFLHERWRVNDWWWGRLDGAAGIIEVLGGRAEDVAEVQRAILADCNEPEKECVTSPAGRGTAGVEGWYRSAIAARIGPLVLRALWPDRLSSGAIVSVLQAVGLLLMRPLAVVAAVAVDPRRLATVVSIVLCGAALLGTGDVHGARFVLAATFAVIGMATGYRGLRALRRWAALDRKLDELVPDGGFVPDAYWKTAFRSGRRNANICIVGTLLSMAVAVAMTVLICVRSLSWEATLSVVGVLFASLLLLNDRSLRVARRARASGKGTGMSLGMRRAVPRLLLVVGITGIVVTTWCDGMSWSDDAYPGAAVAGVTAGLLTLLTVGHWARWRWVCGLTLVVAGIAAAAQYVAAGMLGPNMALDLLPTGVWLVAVGAVLQRVRTQSSAQLGLRGRLSGDRESLLDASA